MRYVAIINSIEESEETLKTFKLFNVRLVSPTPLKDTLPPDDIKIS